MKRPQRLMLRNKWLAILSAASVPTLWIGLAALALPLWQTGLQQFQVLAQHIAQLPLIVPLSNLMPKGNIVGTLPGTVVVVAVTVGLCGLCWSRFHHHRRWLAREDEHRELRDI